MIMKRSLWIITLVLGFAAAKAQQLPQYTQYQLNNFVINPAVAGTDDHWQAKLNNRNQWVGITDAPRTSVFSLYGPMLKRMGIGGFVFNDVTGPTRRLGGQVAYSYHFKLNDKMKIALGASFGLVQYVVDGAKITTQELGDNALSNGIQSKLNPDAGGGAYFYTDKFYVGLSAPQMLTSKLDFFEDYEETSSRQERHYFLTGGYMFDITDEIQVQPSFQAKLVSPVQPQVDLGVRGIYSEMVWLGASYRTGEDLGGQEAISAQLGYTFQKNLTFAYSYDITLSDIRSVSNGSHEIMFAVRFQNNKSPK